MKPPLILVPPDGVTPLKLMRTAQSDVEEEHLPEVKRLFHPK